MKILGLDSSGIVASVAIVEDDALIAEYTVNYKKTHSQTLLPMLDEIAKMTELDLNSIDAIAVAAGPGSFTGLRIGSATAKGLPSLEAASVPQKKSCFQPSAASHRSLRFSAMQSQTGSPALPDSAVSAPSQ